MWKVSGKSTNEINSFLYNHRGSKEDRGHSSLEIHRFFSYDAYCWVTFLSRFHISKYSTNRNRSNVNLTSILVQSKYHSGQKNVTILKILSKERQLIADCTCQFLEWFVHLNVKYLNLNLRQIFYRQPGMFLDDSYEEHAGFYKHQ